MNSGRGLGDAIFPELCGVVHPRPAEKSFAEARAVPGFDPVWARAGRSAEQRPLASRELDREGSLHCHAPCMHLCAEARYC